MKLNIGPGENDTPYMLSALDIGVNITDKFRRSEPWFRLCDKDAALRNAFAMVDRCVDEDSTSMLSQWIRAIDRNADALEIVQADDDLSYPYLTAKRLLALCETDDSRIHALADDAGFMGISWWSASDFETAIQRVLDDENEVPKWVMEKLDESTVDKMVDALMERCEDFLEPDHSDTNERIDSEAMIVVCEELGL